MLVGTGQLRVSTVAFWRGLRPGNKTDFLRELRKNLEMYRKGIYKNESINFYFLDIQNWG